MRHLSKFAAYAAIATVLSGCATTGQGTHAAVPEPVERKHVCDGREGKCAAIAGGAAVGATAVALTVAAGVMFITVLVAGVGGELTK
ncbi:hypothetical protein [Notoacmeibacter marinus]|uniref:hypothetical protein n=1 Tax=Notoacmeibacter marinus TaxID=1876515 RepID=UPI000DF47987|nr:hypothetical protein [Notoacmeibacter marinus]